MYDNFGLGMIILRPWYDQRHLSGWQRCDAQAPPHNLPAHHFLFVFGDILLIERGIRKVDVSSATRSRGLTMATITHAYVRYVEDKRLKIVPITDIKSFHPEYLTDFNKDQAYKVKWIDADDCQSDDEVDDFYDAQIALLGESQLDVEKKIGSIGRLRFPLVTQYSNNDISSPRSDEDKKVKERRTRSKNKTLFTPKSDSASQLATRILNQKKKQIKNKRIKEPSSPESDQCETLKESDGSDVEFQTNSVQELEKTVRELKETIAELEQRYEKAKSEKATLSKELQTYTELNKNLQQQILELLKGNKRKSAHVSSDTDPKSSSAAVQQSAKKPKNDLSESVILGPSRTPEHDFDFHTGEHATNYKKSTPSSASSCSTFEQVQTEEFDVHPKPSYISLKNTEIEKKSTLLPAPYTTCGDQVHLKDGIYVSKDAWESLESKTKDTLFVKDLAVAIWGSYTLKNRSVGGKGIMQLQNRSPRKVLTPKKLSVLRDCFRNKLKRENVQGVDCETRLKGVGKMLSEKINDLNRLDRRNKCTRSLDMDSKNSVDKQ